MHGGARRVAASLSVLLGALAALLGATLQSAAGFGFALIAAPLLVAALGPRPAVSAIVVLALIVSALTLAGEHRRPRPNTREAVVLRGGGPPRPPGGGGVLWGLPRRG